MPTSSLGTLTSFLPRLLVEADMSPCVVPMPAVNLLDGGAWGRVGIGGDGDTCLCVALSGVWEIGVQGVTTLNTRL